MLSLRVFTAIANPKMGVLLIPVFSPLCTVGCNINATVQCRIVLTPHHKYFCSTAYSVTLMKKCMTYVDCIAKAFGLKYQVNHLTQFLILQFTNYNWKFMNNLTGHRIEQVGQISLTSFHQGVCYLGQFMAWPSGHGPTSKTHSEYARWTIISVLTLVE